MERKLTAELWDKMHYLFRGFNDRMVHVALYYDYKIDIQALKTVILCFLEKAPVLHSSFIDTKLTAHWRVNDYTIDDVLTVRESNDLQKDADEFLTQYIEPEAPVQIRFAVFHNETESVLCIVENHMCMDGGDLKYFVRSFCQAYTDYVQNGKSPISLREGSRSYDEIYRDFSRREKKMAQNLYKNVCAKDDHRFPLTENNLHDKSFIALRKIDADRFTALRKAGKTLGATVNDLLVAAYFYSLYELGNYGLDESVTISCAIDLRRHVKDTEGMGITNHTAFMQCNIPERGKDIFETLEYTKQSVEKFKNDPFMGLYGLPLLKFGYGILPQSAAEGVIKLGYSNPLLAMSNIGLLDSEGYSLCGKAPKDGFMTGAVKYKPFALVSATSLNGVLSLSMCVRGNEEDKRIVERFFDLMESNLQTLTNGK